MSKINLKESLVQLMMRQLDERIVSTRKDVEAAKESRDSDTKSTAGDKHETGRAMMQRELKNQEMQLNKAVTFRNQLAQINTNQYKNKVEYGSLAFTNAGNYFFSIPVGKIEFDGNTFFAISMNSPIGQAMRGKKTGAGVQFQGREIAIEKIT